MNYLNIYNDIEYHLRSNNDVITVLFMNGKT